MDTAVTPGARRQRTRFAVAAIACSIAATSVLGRQQRALESAPEGPGRRVALVIGNDAYAHMPQLRNAVNDATAVTTALKKYGFEVDLAPNATLRELNRRIDQFGAKLRANDVALVYYAGHGIQIENENYLVPVDFNAQDEVDAKYDSYPASRIADRMAASGVRLSMLILDACRNNPFRSTRSGTRGLAPMDTGRGSLVAFATAPNRTADDNPSARNGLFTTYLLDAMDQPELSVEQVFSRVRQKVYEASGGRQIPWLVSSVIGDFYFRAPAAGSSGDADKPVRAFSTGAAGPARVYFHLIRAGKAEVFESFVEQFKRTLQASERPIHRQQAAGWRIFKSTDPGPDGQAWYLSVIDPLLPNANYSVSQVLTEAAPQQAGDLYARFYDAVASQNVIDLKPVVAFASAIRSVSAPAAPPAADKDAMIFTSEAGIILSWIKPEKVEQFEQVIGRLKQAFELTRDPVRQQQARGWTVYRGLEPSPKGPILYFFFFDPVVRGADYRVSRILSEAFPGNELELLRQYADSHAESTNRLNLRLVAELGAGR